MTQKELWTNAHYESQRGTRKFYRSRNASVGSNVNVEEVPTPANDVKTKVARIFLCHNLGGSCDV